MYIANLICVVKNKIPVSISRWRFCRQEKIPESFLKTDMLCSSWDKSMQLGDIDWSPVLCYCCCCCCCCCCCSDHVWHIWINEAEIVHCLKWPNSWTNITRLKSQNWSREKPKRAHFFDYSILSFKCVFKQPKVCLFCFLGFSQLCKSFKLKITI